MDYLNDGQIYLMVRGVPLEIAMAFSRCQTEAFRCLYESHVHPPLHPFILSLNNNGRALMKRDMELIRLIFAKIEDRTMSKAATVEVEGYDPATVARHLELLLHAGLIEGTISHELGRPYPFVMVKDLSWQGHDFSLTLLDENVWSKMKQIYSVNELAKLPIEVIKTVGMGLLSNWAKAKAGL